MRTVASSSSLKDSFFFFPFCREPERVVRKWKLKVLSVGEAGWQSKALRPSMRASVTTSSCRMRARTSRLRASSSMRNILRPCRSSTSTSQSVSPPRRKSMRTCPVRTSVCRCSSSTPTACCISPLCTRSVFSSRAADVSRRTSAANVEPIALGSFAVMPVAVR